MLRLLTAAGFFALAILSGFRAVCTVSVAASDSAQHLKAKANYICDGSGDQVQIQNAIDSISAGTVCLLPGTYFVDQDGTNEWCILIDKSNITVLFRTGALVKLTDGQFEAGEVGHVFRIGSGYATPPPLRENITIWGPGRIDGNRDNNPGHTSINNNSILDCRGHLRNLAIGGGLTIENAQGQGLHVQGVSVGGDPSSPYLAEIIATDLQIIGCGEGMLVNLCDRVSVHRLLIDGTIEQDGFEPLAVHNLIMTDSVIWGTHGSALDIFGGSGTQSYGLEDHLYSRCILGPVTLGQNLVAIGVNTTVLATNRRIVITDSILDIANVNRAGIAIGQLNGTGATATQHVTLLNLIINGSGALPGANGIEIDDSAQYVRIIANTIFNCPGAAIDRTANPDDLSIRDNDGWDNGEGITAGTGARNELIDNRFD